MQTNKLPLKILQTMGVIIVLLLCSAGTYVITLLFLEDRLNVMSVLNVLTLLFLLGSIALICDIFKLKWQLRKRDKRGNENKSVSE